jgi:hypothetical protein
MRDVGQRPAYLVQALDRVGTEARRQLLAPQETDRDHTLIALRHLREDLNPDRRGQ